MTELDELIKQRKALEKDTAQRNAIENEKGKIKELQEQRENDRKSKTVFGKIKKNIKNINIEKVVHPERFKEDGTRRKGKAGRE